MPVKIVIKPDGEQQVEAEGHTGPSCSTATQPFLKEVEVIEDTPKPEFYADQDVGEGAEQEQTQ